MLASQGPTSSERTGHLTLPALVEISGFHFVSGGD
jgi:hypothetical protein